MKKREWLSAFRYVVPADYELWFEGMASKGWHPSKIGQWSSLLMNFEKGTPKKYRYVVDLQAIPGKDYKATYAQFGWEFIGQMASMFVWRKEYTNERPESFSDIESIRRRNKRFVAAISFSLVLFLLTTIALVVYVAFDTSDTGMSIWEKVLSILLSGLFTVYLGNVMLKIQRNKSR